MSKALPWYKRNPTDWRDGTRSKEVMSLELRGFYSECLDAMWELQRQLPKDAKAIAMMLGTNPRMVRALMPKLIAAGKIVETVIGYYNPRMMADILGVKDIVQTGEFAPASDTVGDRVEVESRSTGDRVEVEPRPKIQKTPMFSTRDLEGDREEDKKEVKDAGAGALSIDQSTIKHRGFSISIDAVHLGIAGRLPKAEVARICQAHALQWATEIDAGKSPSSVVPTKIANFLVASVMGEVNRAASAEVRSIRPAVYRGGGRPQSAAEAKREREAALMAKLNAAIAAEEGRAVQ
jgi:hypothetical protein